MVANAADAVNAYAGDRNFPNVKYAESRYAGEMSILIFTRRSFVQAARSSLKERQGRRTDLRKDNIHDYTAEAFRYYALMRSGAAISNDPAAIEDINAVDRVIDSLKNQPDGDISLRCLELVYFTQPRSLPKRGAITDRTRYASMQLGLSEADVYRRLRRLRENLAAQRGLRVG